MAKPDSLCKELASILGEKASSDNGVCTCPSKYATPHICATNSRSTGDRNESRLIPDDDLDDDY